jgi:esterase/lipase superfamily enzyme
MNERYIKWYTPWLSREFEMLAFGNGGGLPLIIFPTSFRQLLSKQRFWARRFSRELCRCWQSHRLLPGRDRSGKFLQQEN